MKKIFKLITLLLLTNTLLNGQYIPFVEEGKFWIYLNLSPTGERPKPDSGNAITFLGDTTINSIDYKKIMRLDLKGRHDCSMYEIPCWDFDFPYQTKNKSLIGYIREDTLQKKIYILFDPNTGEEDILFDFSLNIGDTLNNRVYESIWAGSTYSPSGGIVDSIKVIDSHGKSRNSIFTYGFFTSFGLPYETTIAISEGLGYEDFGIFYEPRSIFADYCEGQIEQCNLILSNELIASDQEIKIYPNPSNGIFQIETERELRKLNVYSILGQMRAESPFTNKIDLSNFKSGIYLLQIITENDEIIVKKIQIKS